MVENYYSSRFGLNYIAAGMNYDPFDLLADEAFTDEFKDAIKDRDAWVEKVEESAKKEPTHFEYLKEKIYSD